MAKVIEFKKSRPGFAICPWLLRTKDQAAVSFEFIAVHQSPRGPTGDLCDKQSVIGVHVRLQIVPELNCGPGAVRGRL